MQTNLTGQLDLTARFDTGFIAHTLVTGIEIAHQTNDLGRYTALGDGDLFDMEYWVLEQAKLGKGSEPPLAGQVALVTGAVGAIGFGICKRLVAAGAHVVLTDIDQAKLDAAVAELDPKSRGLAAGGRTRIRNRQCGRQAGPCPCDRARSSD